MAACLLLIVVDFMGPSEPGPIPEAGVEAVEAAAFAGPFFVDIVLMVSNF